MLRYYDFAAFSPTLTISYPLLPTLTRSSPLLPALTRFSPLLIFRPYIPEQIFLEWINVLLLTFKGVTAMLKCKGFQLTYPLLLSLISFYPFLKFYLLLIFWTQYYFPHFFYTKFYWTKKNGDTNPKKNGIYIFTRVKISTYDLCLG